MANCCSSIAQAILLVVNLVIFLCGVTVLGGGIYMEVNMSKYLDFLENQAVTSSIVFIIIGAMIALVSFLGCCGACTGNACLMKTYGGILCILLIAEIGTAVAIYVFKGDIKDLLDTNLNKTLKTYGQEDFKAPTATWDSIQADFKCCGVTQFADWKESPEMQKDNSVPASCCIKVDDPGCGKGLAVKTKEQVKDTIYTEGCLNTVETTLNDNVGVAAGIGAAIGVIQLVTIIAAFCVGKKMDMESDFS